MSRLARDGTGRLNTSREAKFSGAYGDRGIYIFRVQLTTSRIGNLTRLIHTLKYVMTMHTYYIPIVGAESRFLFVRRVSCAFSFRIVFLHLV